MAFQGIAIGIQGKKDEWFLARPARHGFSRASSNWTTTCDEVDSVLLLISSFKGPLLTWFVRRAQYWEIQLIARPKKGWLGLLLPWLLSPKCAENEQVITGSLSAYVIMSKGNTTQHCCRFLHPGVSYRSPEIHFVDAFLTLE